MKSSKKLICCVAIVVVLGVGVTVAAQAANAGKEQIVSDTVSEPSLSESSISEMSEPETDDSEVSDSVPDDTDGSSVTSEKTESAPVDADEEEQQPPETVKQYLPTANAPDDIDYCDVNDFLPTGDWGGSVIIETEPRSEVYAVSGGEVIFTDYEFGGGHMIIIKHEDGLYGLYYHLDLNDGVLVKKGDIVEAGQLIGLTGNTGLTDKVCLGYKCCSNPFYPAFLLRHPEMAEYA